MARAAYDLARRMFRRLAVRRRPQAAAGAPAGEREMLEFLRECLARTLADAVIPRLGHGESLAREARAIAEGFRRAQRLAELRTQAAALRRFWIHLELRGETLAEELAGALAFAQLAVRALGETAAGDRALESRIAQVEDLLAEPPSRERLRAAERLLREVLYRQAALRRSEEETRAALRAMLARFLGRLDQGVPEGTGPESRAAEYARRIEAAQDLASLAALLVQLASDTRLASADLVRAREELEALRQSAQAREAEVARLRKELDAAALLVREDPLTGALNRRGLEEAFAAEASRADRRAAPLSLALADLDDFKRLNDRYGHATGDAALAHFARVLRTALRPSDVLARHGGEEFVIVLPETARGEAARVLARLQRVLAASALHHEAGRIALAFSAGVAERAAGEGLQALLARADRAMYAAKRAGKNCVRLAA